MLKRILRNIRQDLDRISNIDSSVLFEKMIQSKLDNSYDMYCRNLEINYNYLLTRSTVKVLRNVKKQREKKEKSGE